MGQRCGEGDKVGLFGYGLMGPALRFLQTDKSLGPRLRGEDGDFCAMAPQLRIPRVGGDLRTYQSDVILDVEARCWVPGPPPEFILAKVGALETGVW